MTYSEWDTAGGYPNDNGGSKQCVAFVRLDLGFHTGWRNFECDSGFRASYKSLCQINSCDTDTYCP